MFRSATGFKAQYGGLALQVAADFDEWRILVQGPGVTIQGGRQFSEARAKEQARKVAEDYFQQVKHEGVPGDGDLDWLPLDPGEWMNWRP